MENKSNLADAKLTYLFVKTIGTGQIIGGLMLLFVFRLWNLRALSRFSAALNLKLLEIRMLS